MNIINLSLEQRRALAAKFLALSLPEREELEVKLVCYCNYWIFDVLNARDLAEELDCKDKTGFINYNKGIL